MDKLQGSKAYWSITRLAFPILVGQLGMIVVGFVDTKMVGLYSTGALASASFVNNIFNIAIFACIGFTYGITPLAGALFARGSKCRIGRLLHNGLILNGVFAIVVTAIMAALYFNLPNLGQPEELLPLIRPYYLLYLAGIIPIAVFNVYAQWSYAINRTALPMWIILGCNVINIAGNWALIYGNWGAPELGLTGAGIATLASRVISAVTLVGIFHLHKQFRDYRDGYRESKINRKDIKHIARTSWPVSLQMTFESGSFSIAAIMTGWIGAVPLASFQIMVMLGTLGFCVYYSVAAAVSVLVSNAAGIGDRPLMRHVAFCGYHILLLLAAVASLLFWFCGPSILHQFTDDPAVLSLSLTLIVPLILYQFADATQINFANALRGTSNVMPMMWISFFSYIVVGIPATYALGFIAGMETYGIFLSFTVSLLMAAVLFAYFFLKTTKKR